MLDSKESSSICGPDSIDVARPRQIEVTPGDKILIRANDKRLGLINGQV